MCFRRDKTIEMKLLQKYSSFVSYLICTHLIVGRQRPSPQYAKVYLAPRRLVPVSVIFTTHDVTSFNIRRRGAARL